MQVNPLKMQRLRDLFMRFLGSFGRKRARNLAICTAVALVLALLTRFGTGMLLGGSEIAAVGVGGPRIAVVSTAAGEPDAPDSDAADSADKAAEGDASADKGDGVADIAKVDPADAGKSGSMAEAGIPDLDSFRRPIIPRSLFDSANVEADLSDEVSSLAVTNDPFLNCPKSDISVELVLTMETMPVELGAALMKGGEKGKEKARVYQVGDEITADATLWAVYRRKVMLQRNDGRVECLSIGDEEPVRKPAKGSDKPAAKGGGKWGTVEKVGDNEWEVGSEDIAYAMENIDKLSRDARITQYYKDGQRAGFRLSSIRRNGVFGKLGMRNNDVITSVNGMSITSTDQALRIYQNLQSEQNFSVEVQRRGQPQTLRYSIK